MTMWINLFLSIPQKIQEFRTPNEKGSDKEYSKQNHMKRRGLRVFSSIIVVSLVKKGIR